MVAIDLLHSFNQKYDNNASGLVANNAQNAIDEIASRTDINSIASTSWTSGTNTYRITSLDGTNYDTVISDFSALSINSAPVATIDEATAFAIALG